MGDSDKLMDVESGPKETHGEDLPSDDNDEGGKVCWVLGLMVASYNTSILSSYSKVSGKIPKYIISY